jgi:hypothetical protein
MASSALRCPNCNSTFTHVRLEDTFENFFWAPKTNVPRPMVNQLIIRIADTLTGISNLIGYTKLRQRTSRRERA